MWRWGVEGERAAAGRGVGLGRTVAAVGAGAGCVGVGGGKAGRRPDEWEARRDWG